MGVSDLREEEKKLGAEVKGDACVLVDAAYVRRGGSPVMGCLMLKG